MNRNEMINMNKILVGVTMGLLLLVLPAAASDFTLDIFGNTNEDDTINIQDVTYTEKIVLEYKDETKLADAKYDGEIDILDVTQIELIMLGEEKELTFIDDMYDVITVQKPINRIVLIEGYAALYETWRALDIDDKVVGINARYTEPGGARYSERYYPELITKQCVGSTKEPDIEQIISLAPDILYIDWGPMYGIKPKIAEVIPNLPVICMDITDANFTRNTIKTGYIFDKRKEAGEYINWRNNWKNTIEELTAELPDDERPIVFLSSYMPEITEFSIRGGPRYDPLIIGAGGKSISEGMTPFVKVDAEWILERNPDIIIFTAGVVYCGYDFDDPSELADLYKNFMNRPEFKQVNAIKNKKVYFINLPHLLYGGASGTITEAYFAKWMQPDLTTDIHPQQIHQEFLEFQGLDLSLNQHAVFVYPPLEDS